MSAYVVDPETINRILTKLKDETTDGYIHNLIKDLEFDISSNDLLSDLGLAMYNTNANAVGQRYNESEFENLPGSITENGKLVPYEFKLKYCPNSLQPLKSLHCWIYQCSEGNVSDTKIYKAFEEIAAMWAKRAVDSMPGYQAADWS